MSARLLATFLTLLAAGTAQAGTGTVKGTVTAAGKPVADAAVLIEGSALPDAVGAPHAVIDQRHEAFVPHVLAVQVGTTVDFPNHDPMLHNVFSASPAKKFDLGMYPEGETRSMTFDRPGVVRIGCNVHPKMEAFIVVSRTSYVAVTDASGSYTITGIPEGTHQLRVWQETSDEQTVPVTVHDGQVEHVDVRISPRH
jgi:plastocyanin